MFSRRVVGDIEPNAIARRVAALRTADIIFVDLTESNPTRVGIPYPPGLLAPLGDDTSISYHPSPFGLRSARAAVAADYGRRGSGVSADAVVLTASTSEAYSWLFKLLCNPGDAVLVPRPSYPLFDHLTVLEGVRSAEYELEYHGRWAIDFSSLERAPDDTRAVIVVSPNNPTGSTLSAEEFRRILEVCERRGWALIADEVFVDYPLDMASPLTDLASRNPRALTFTLGGLSKSLGLPQVKLGWIVVGGPPELTREALGRLEVIADTFLSVGTPIQQAAATLLASAKTVRDAIRARVSRNLATLRGTIATTPASDVLPVDGGWSAVIRVPATRSEEQIVLDLLERERILVHPGYFFDFRREAYLIVSLLPEADIFADAIARLARATSL